MKEAAEAERRAAVQAQRALDPNVFIYDEDMPGIRREIAALECKEVVDKHESFKSKFDAKASDPAFSAAKREKFEQFNKKVCANFAAFNTLIDTKSLDSTSLEELKGGLQEMMEEIIFNKMPESQTAWHDAEKKAKNMIPEGDPAEIFRRDYVSSYEYQEMADSLKHVHELLTEHFRPEAS